MTRTPSGIFSYDFTIFYTVGWMFRDQGWDPVFYDYKMDYFDPPDGHPSWTVNAHPRLRDKFVELHDLSENYPYIPRHLMPIPLSPYVYPPPCVFPFSLFALTTFDRAQHIWFFLNHLLFGMALYLALGGCRRVGGAGSFFAPLAVLLSLTHPAWHSFMLGQTTTLVFILAMVAWRSSSLGRPRLAGFFLAFAGAIKVFPALFVFHWVLRKRWREVGWFLGWCVVIHLVSILLLGLRPYSDYSEALGRISGLVPTQTINASPDSILSQWKIPDLCTGPLFGWTSPDPMADTAASGFRALIVLSILSLARIELRRGFGAFDRAGAAFFSLAACVFAMRISWDHYYILMYPLLLWSGVRLIVSSSCVRERVLRSVLYFLVSVFFLAPLEWRSYWIQALLDRLPPGGLRYFLFIVLNNGLFFGGVLLLLVSYLLLRSGDPEPCPNSAAPPGAVAPPRSEVSGPNPGQSG